MRGVVLDSSALFYGKDFPPGWELVVSPGVIRELEKHGMGERMEFLLAARVRVFSPGARSLDRVRKEAGRTGDLAKLSETDLEILALGLDHGYEIVSDDYAIQNVAEALGIPHRGIDQKGITHAIEWKARCTGCGKMFGPDVTECDVCGSPTKRKKGKVKPKGQ